jgi:hypothetical protein
MSSEAGHATPRKMQVSKASIHRRVGRSRRLLLASLCVILCGCEAAQSVRLDKAQRIAQSGGLNERDIAAGRFLLRSYERIGDPANGTARVYIEGDGLAWLGKNRPSPDPTPINPVALSLAQADRGANVAYLARPCQYNGAFDEKACPEKYWKSARFSPEIVKAMNDALDGLKRRHGLHRFELVGYSGGGAVAVLMAAGRSDIASIRTVAGNLNTVAFSKLHNVSAMTESLNPASVARRINAIPQMHFVGGRDAIVPIGIYQTYRDAAGPSKKVGVIILPGADHETGWVEQWPALLARQL